MSSGLHTAGKSCKREASSKVHSEKSHPRQAERTVSMALCKSLWSKPWDRRLSACLRKALALPLRVSMWCHLQEKKISISVLKCSVLVCNQDCITVYPSFPVLLALGFVEIGGARRCQSVQSRKDHRPMGSPQMVLKPRLCPARSWFLLIFLSRRLGFLFPQYGNRVV